MIHFKRKIFRSATCVLIGFFFLGPLMAQTPKIPLRSEKFSCNGRSVPAAADASGKIIYPDLLIQEAMKGKLFKKSPERSMKEVESRVISERGMRD